MTSRVGPASRRSRDRLDRVARSWPDLRWTRDPGRATPEGNDGTDGLTDLLPSSGLNHVAPRTRILVVDDEGNLRDLVRGYLEREGYDVHEAADGPSALERARSLNPQLVILDVMLPGLDGIEVCREIRRFSNAYVLMLTARVEEVDKIVGLTVGADEYMTKPFSPRELVARVRAMLRRPLDRPSSLDDADAAQRLGELSIDRSRRVVTLRGEEIDLTAREFDLLAMLAEHPGRVFTRAQLLDGVWGSEFYDDHVVEVHVANLRRKIEDDAGPPRYVQTVRGVGYRVGVPG